MAIKQLTGILFMLVMIICISSEDIPANCRCYSPNNDLCDTRGCSSDKTSCNRKHPAFSAVIPTIAAPIFYYGCTCPGSPYSDFGGTNHNGLYRGRSYDYTNCMNFGSNANNNKDEPNAAIAGGCCNFCCNRNDGTSSVVSSRHQIIVRISICSSF